jgi:hypothetical protein
MKYRVIQYRRLVCEITAQDSDEAQEIAQDLSDEDFEVVDWSEEIVEQETA